MGLRPPQHGRLECATAPRIGLDQQKRFPQAASTMRILLEFVAVFPDSEARDEPS
jgi:hypothetical protein